MIFVILIEVLLIIAALIFVFKIIEYFDYCGATPSLIAVAFMLALPAAACFPIFVAVKIADMIVVQKFVDKNNLAIKLMLSENTKCFER